MWLSLVFGIEGSSTISVKESLGSLGQNEIYIQNSMYCVSFIQSFNSIFNIKKALKVFFYSGFHSMRIMQSVKFNVMMKLI